jgi:hypothetical protein
MKDKLPEFETCEEHIKIYWKKLENPIWDFDNNPPELGSWRQ